MFSDDKGGDATPARVARAGFHVATRATSTASHVAASARKPNFHLAGRTAGPVEIRQQFGGAAGKVEQLRVSI